MKLQLYRISKTGKNRPLIADVELINGSMMEFHLSPNITPKRIPQLLQDLVYRELHGEHSTNKKRRKVN